MPNDAVTIVPMTTEHIPEVCRAELECFTLPWSRASFERELTENQYAMYYVALCGDKLAGYAGMWHVVNEGHITNIAVRPAYRMKGVGGMLLDKLTELAIQKEMIGITLEVRAGNLAALSMYSKHGFKHEGLRKEYYEDNHEDAIIMWKYL